MAVEMLVLVIAVILVLVLAWGFFKHVFRMIIPVGIAILLVIAATTFLIYRDIADLRDNLRDSTKKIIVVDNDKVLTGFVLRSQVRFLTGEQLEEFSAYLQDKDYSKVLGSSYRLMVFDIGIISELGADAIDINGKTIAKSSAVSILRSEEPAAMLKQHSINEDDLEISKNDMEDSSRVKAALFAIILSDEVLSPKNPLLLFSGFKEGSIVVYPETALFKAANILPISFIGNAGKTIFGEKEKVKAFVAD